MTEFPVKPESQETLHQAVHYYLYHIMSNDYLIPVIY